MDPLTYAFNVACLTCRWLVHAKCRNSFSFGSIVQKGKFSAAAALFVNTLKNVDFLQKRWRTANTLYICTYSHNDRKPSILTSHADAMLVDNQTAVLLMTT